MKIYISFVSFVCLFVLYLGKDPIQWTTRLQMKNAAILSNFLLLLPDVVDVDAVFSVVLDGLFFVCGDESAALIFLLAGSNAKHYCQFKY
jgi:hypothetical protein